MNFQTAALGFARLSASASALNVPMSQQKELFDAYAKASTVLHLSSEESQRALLALEQMMSKGKIQAQELRLQLGQAIPGAAERFQLAVMKMVKGTELEGKSFDQLLKQGKLYTAQFLPAVIEALQESTRGWEEASAGLNAQLNRLRTAWFKVKADVSGGLFDDATVATVKFLAGNLSTIATVAEGGLAIGGAHLASKGLVSLSGHVAALRGLTAARIADAQATAMQAERELAQASAGVSSTAIAKANNAAKIESLKTTLAETTGEKERTVILNRLNAATARQVELNLASRDSLASLTAAQTAAKASEAELAAARSAGVVGNAARGAGKLALGLVGGWAGVAVLAIGGVAYAAYKLQKQWENNREEAKKQAQTVDQLTEKLKQLDKAYQSATTGATVKELAQGATDAIAQLSTLNEKIAKDEAELAQLQSLARRQPERQGLMAGQISAVRRELDNLKMSRDALSASISHQVDLVESRVLPLYKNKLNKQIQDFTDKVMGAKGAIDLLHAAWNLDLSDKSIIDKLSEGAKKLSGAVDDLKQQYHSLKDANDKKQFGTAGVLERDYKNTIHSDEFKNRSEAQKREYMQAYALALSEAKRQDAIKSTTKAQQASAQASEQRRKSYNNLVQSIRQHNNQVRAEIDGNSKLSPSQKTLNDLLGGTNKAYNAADVAGKAALIRLAAEGIVLDRANAKRKQHNRDLEETARINAKIANLSSQRTAQQ